MVHDEDEIQGRELYEFCRHVPKIELHAHLNGSIRPPTLAALVRDCGVALTALVHDDNNNDNKADH